MNPTVSVTRIGGVVGGLQGAHRDPQGGEELVRHVDLLAAQPPHEGGLARVGVPHQGHHVLEAPAGALLALLLRDGLQLLLELGDAVPDLPLVQLRRRLAGASAADPAPLPLPAAHPLPHAGRQVRQPRDLHLEPGGPGLGVAPEDLEDHRGAVQHRDPRRGLEVPGLAGGHVVIQEHHVGPLVLGERRVVALRLQLLRRLGLVLQVLLLGGRAVLRHLARAAGVAGQLLELAPPHHRGPREPRAGLGDPPDDLVAQGVGQAPELIQGGLEGGVGDVGELHADEDGARGGFGHGAAQWRGG
jgi:hypothetical protein